MANQKRTKRADGILSPDELAKAIEEYKAKRSQKQDADTEPEFEEKKEVVAEIEPAPEKKEEKADEDVVVSEEKKAPEKIEEQVEEIKDRHTDDEDVQTLCDIIDTLLAQKAFDEADDEIPSSDKSEEMDDIDKLNKLDTDEEPIDGDLADKEGEDFAADSCKKDGEECENCDEDMEEDIVDVEEKEDGEDEEIVDKKEKILNADSIDAIVRQRIKIGLIGRELNMDGLENKSIKAAKKAIIKAVRPNVRLDGKSDTYINVMYDLAVADVESRNTKDTSYQKKQMFNRDAKDVLVANDTSANAARERMIARQQRKNKEDK